MTSFLPAIRKGIAKGFRDKLSKGKLRRRTPILNNFNDVQTLSYVDYNFDGIRENFDAAWAARALIPQTDVKILIILGSLPSTIVPNQNDLIYIAGFWHQIRRVLEIDPASASASLQAFVIDGPN